MSWVDTSHIRHPDDVRKALGFTGEPSGFDLVRQYDYARQAGEGYRRGDLRVAWKIASDPYYWAAFKRYQSLPMVVNAGFFDDGLEPGELAPLTNPHMLTTPLETIRAKVEQLEKEGRIHDKKLVVLLTTGCFAPVHDSHIEMMEQARKAAEENGYEVIGGFMSPSHDDYVSTKGDDARRLTAPLRMTLLNRALESSDWISADPWESRYAPTDINFTDTIVRLQNYINAHINTPVPIEVAYVCGADNVQFARTFVEKGLAICVPRPGMSEQLERVRQAEELTNNPHIIFASPTSAALSSTAVRKGEAVAIQKLDSDQGFNALLKGEARRLAMGQDEKTQTYLVRDDLSWATDQWRGKVEPSILAKAIKNFREGLVRAIENAFEQTHTPGYPNNVEVLLMSVEEQMRAARAIMEIDPDRVINNDIITGGEQATIGMSRLFNLSSPQFRAGELIARPGRMPLDQLFGRLRKGTFTMVDDDIATGTTMRLLEEKLPEGVKLGEKIALSERAFKAVHPDKDYAFWDIVDARDFLLGARSGGLVVKLFNGAVGRAPYIMPYTSLVSRAKIPPDQEKEFSREVLNLNRRFFRDIRADLSLNDTDPQFQQLMKTAGFQPRTHMTDVCVWHDKYMKAGL